MSESDLSLASLSLDSIIGPRVSRRKMNEYDFSYCCYSVEFSYISQRTRTKLSSESLPKYAMGSLLKKLEETYFHDTTDLTLYNPSMR